MTIIDRKENENTGIHIEKSEHPLEGSANNSKYQLFRVLTPEEQKEQDEKKEKLFSEESFRRMRDIHRPDLKDKE